MIWAFRFRRNVHGALKCANVIFILSLSLLRLFCKISVCGVWQFFQKQRQRFLIYSILSPFKCICEKKLEKFFFSIKVMCCIWIWWKILRKWQSACIGMWHVYEENGNFLLYFYKCGALSNMCMSLRSMLMSCFRDSLYQQQKWNFNHCQPARALYDIISKCI